MPKNKKPTESVKSLRALYETTHNLSAQYELSALLQTIADNAVKLLKSNSAAMYLYDSASGELELTVKTGFPIPVGTRLKMGEGMAGRVAQSREPQITDDYQAWESRSSLYEGIPFRAVAEVPMLYGGDLIGVLAVTELGESLRKYSQADLQLLSLFASPAASAVCNARLFDETRRRAEEFATLYDTARALATETELTGLLQTIVERTATLLSAPRSTMYLFNEEQNFLEVAFSTHSEVPLGTRLELGEGMAGRVAQTREPLIIDDYQTWEGRSPKFVGERFSAVVEVPMLFRGQLVGVLSAREFSDSKRKFTEADVRLLSLFASQAAGAVHNARLLDETRHRAEQLTLLYDAGLTLNGTLEPRAQLEFLCTIATKALHADNTSFFRCDAARNDLYLEFGVGLGQEMDVLRDLRFPLGAERGLIGWVAQNRAPLYLPDVTADPRWIASDPAIHSALWVPVLHDEQLLGVLSASSTRLNAFTSQDERLFLLFANQVAVAMENARLFVETRQRLAELDAVNRISTALRAATTLDEMLPRLLDETLAVLGTSAGAISLYDPNREKLEQVIARGWFTQTPQTASADDDIAGRVMATGQSYVAREFKPDPSTSDLTRDQVPNGWGGALVPIRAAHEIIGTLAVSVLLPRELTSGEVDLLTTLAEIAGNAIHRTRLHAQTETGLQQLQALHTIDIAITGSTDLDVTLNLLLSQVAAQLSVDAASILLLNPVTQMLEYAAGHGFRTRGIEQSRLHLGEGYAGKAALTQRMTHAPNLQDAGSAFARAKLLSGEDFISYYAVPLISKGQVKGLLDIFHRAPLELGPEKLDFLQALATQAAIAIESVQLFENLQGSNMDLALAYDATIEGWSHALDLRDKETEGHTLRVTEITMRLAKAMGIGDAELVHIRRGGLLHDIGKMGVPDSILFKPGPLTDDEWRVMRLHPRLAYDMLSPISYLRPALDIPYCHHEKWDGTGYPRGLKGEQIPLAARLFSVVDVWDALRSDRPYRKAWNEERVGEHISSLSGTHFDPNVVPAFLRLMEQTSHDAGK